MRNKKRFEALRNFTLESGQEELERGHRQRKEGTPLDSLENLSRTNSIESVRSPVTAQRQPSLRGVPEEESTFAIGDDDDDETDEEPNPTPSESSPIERTTSRAASVRSSIDDAVPMQVRGMSEKARGKMPAGTPTFSRQNSTTSLGSYGNTPYQSDGSFQPTTQWIESWLPELPLHTLLTLIPQLEKHLSSYTPPDSTGTTPTINTNTPPPSLLQAISKAPIRSIEPSRIRIHSFEWSPLSLGWYESLLWGFVFTGEMRVEKGTVGVWNGTGVRLFRVEVVGREGPSLSRPRGAVDAVGRGVVERIGSMSLGGLAGTGATNANAAGRADIGSRRTSQQDGAVVAGNGTRSPAPPRPNVRTV